MVWPNQAVPDVGRITRSINVNGIDIDDYLDISPIISNNREVGLELKRGWLDARMRGKQDRCMLVAADDPAIRVLEQDEIARTIRASRCFRDDAQHRQRFEQRFVDAAADVTDYCRFTLLQPQHVDGVDAGVDAADDDRPR